MPCRGGIWRSRTPRRLHRRGCSGVWPQTTTTYAVGAFVGALAPTPPPEWALPPPDHPQAGGPYRASARRRTRLIDGQSHRPRPVADLRPGWCASIGCAALPPHTGFLLAPPRSGVGTPERRGCNQRASATALGQGSSPSMRRGSRSAAARYWPPTWSPGARPLARGCRGACVRPLTNRWGAGWRTQWREALAPASSRVAGTDCRGHGGGSAPTRL